jgi:hypothetical protein
MLDFNALEFDEAYVPDHDVVDCAESFLRSVVTPMYLDARSPMSASVRLIKKVIGSQYTDRRDDIVLYLECEAWSYDKCFWKDVLGEVHSPDNLYCYEQRVVIRHSILSKNEIDEQFGIAEWEDVDIDGFEAKTDSGKIPDDVLQSYFEILAAEWQDLDAQYFEAGCPSLKMLDPRVRTLAIQALRRARREHK